MPAALALLAPGTAVLLRADSTPVPVAQAAPGGAPAPHPAAGADDLRPADRSFILRSVENARLQAEISRLAVTRATSSRLRELAQQMVGDDQTISGALETLARRKALALPLQPTSFADRYRELAAMSGAGFDRACVREIDAANQRALQLCESAVAHARDAEVRDLAGSLLPVVRDHANKSTQLAREL